MYWMFAGYLSSFYVTIVVHAAFTLHSHPRPLMGLAAYFVIIPAMIAAMSAESVVLSPVDWKTKIRRAFDCHTLTRANAFCAGFATGLGVLVCFALAYFFYEVARSGRFALLENYEELIFCCIGLVLLFILAFAPIIPGSLLATRAERHENAP